MYKKMKKPFSMGLMCFVRLMSLHLLQTKRIIKWEM